MIRATSRSRWLLSGLLAVTTCPFDTFFPGPGLDPSWGFAMHAWVTGSAGSVPVTYFTYGPLGFLTVPVVWQTSTYVLALCFSLVVQLLLCRLLLERLRSIAPLLVSVVMVFAIAALATTFTAETFTEVAALAAVQALSSKSGPRRWWLPVAVVVAGLGLLIKFSTGVTLLVLLTLVIVIACPGRPIRRLAVAAGGGLASMVVAWTAFGLLTLHPWSFVTWLHGSREIASGYQAMADERFGPLPGSHYLWGLFIMVALLTTAAVVATRSRDLGQLGAFLAIGLVAYLAFREGFTRHERTHEAVFVAALTVLPFGLTLGTRSRFLLLPLVLVPFSFGIWTQDTPSPAHRYNLVGTVEEISVRLQAAVNPKPVQTEARAEIRDNLRLPPSIVDALHGHRVQVDPLATATIWAYDLTWGPTAVWALYSAYTPWLDNRNVDSLSSPAGPDRILRYVRSGVVDTRIARDESPAYQLAELCRWTPLITELDWQVLAPQANRCAAPTLLESVRFRAGESITVPAPRYAGSIVTVRFRLPAENPLWGLLFKPLTLHNLTVDGRRHRLIRANAGQPMVVVSPDGLAGDPLTFAAQHTTTLSVDLPGEAVFEELVVH